VPEVIFLAAVSFYFAIMIILSIGLRKKYPRIEGVELPSATVIVSARNEEGNIEQCLNSLNNLKYPTGKLDIIIVDDFSDDRTGSIINEYIKDKPLFRNVFPAKDSMLLGKVNAIDTAIKIAPGEIILLTDADCEVSESWAETLASFYYRENIGMVNGFTVLNGEGAFAAMQGIDFIFLLAVAAGAVNMNNPVSCIGNNMSFRKAAYFEVGGYGKLPFSVTEDFALLRGIEGLRKYKIIYPLVKESLVLSKACGSVKELFKQKKRWGRGGIDALKEGFAIMGIAFITNFMILLTPLFFSPVWLYLAVFKLAADYLFLYPVHTVLGNKHQLRYFLYFQVYFIIYTTILPIILIFSRKINWKGRIY
jgi:cellulose synthase/poly-beta-1,6-N-acetylglucosamine synthase-like glycosyltransferase